MSQGGIPVSGVVSSIADWKRLYQYAILELDPNKLPQRIAEARHAILDRAEEMITRTKEEESRDLAYALRMLKLLEQVAEKERFAA